MKPYSTALLLALLTLSSQFARADVLDDAFNNIQQAIADAYHADGDDGDRDDAANRDNSRQYDEHRRQFDERRRQLNDRRRQLDDRQRQLDEERRQLEDEESRLEDEYDR